MEALAYQRARQPIEYEAIDGVEAQVPEAVLQVLPVPADVVVVDQ